MSGAATARLLLYLGALWVIGHASLGARNRAPVADGSHGPRASQLRERRIAALWPWLLCIVAVLALLLLQARDMELDPTIEAWRVVLTGTTWGRNWCLLAVVALSGAVVSLLHVPRLLERLMALGLAVAMGGLGHAAADEGYPLLVRVVDATHLLANGAWIGGLGLVVWHVARATDAVAADGGGRDWSSFSRMASFAAPAAVLTGLMSGWRRVTAAESGDAGALVLPTLGSLLTAEYGQLLLIKTGLVLVMLGLGLMHRRRVLREHAPSTAAIRFELALALGVLAVTGVLTGTAPPGE